MMLSLVALTLGSQLALAPQPALDRQPAMGPDRVILVADTVPNLAVDQNCRDQAKRTDALGGGKDGYGSDATACMRSEHTARDKLQTEWAQFTPATRDRCTAASTMGGLPSYVELLTCLEMDRDARQLERQQSTTVGQSKK